MCSEIAAELRNAGHAQGYDREGQGVEQGEEALAGEEEGGRVEEKLKALKEEAEKKD